MKRTFLARTTPIDQGPNVWGGLQVAIVEDREGKETQIGEYQRNYPSMFNTFCPFMKDGEWFALYSRDYTATRVMSLPECKDLGGEEPASGGFCPVDYYVPYDHDAVVAGGTAGQFG